MVTPKGNYNGDYGYFWLYDSEYRDPPCTFNEFKKSYMVPNRFRFRGTESK